jgi:hypothetical protein
MKYEKPEVMELTTAINAIQTDKLPEGADSPDLDNGPAYEDWE